MKTIFLTIMFINTACSYLPEIVEPVTTNQANAASRIFISNHGWHTGVVIESSVLTEGIPELAGRFAGSDYLEVGWGDAGFYQAKDITFGLVVQALLWPTEAVVHVVGIPGHPEAYFPANSLHSLRVNEDNLSSLVGFIRSSFAFNQSGVPETLQQGIYGDSQFYHGVGSYYLFNTCNTWTAKALYSAGLDINPMLKLTASGITDYLKGLEKYDIPAVMAE